MAALAGLGVLALVDSTSFGTLVVPILMMLQPRVRYGHVGLYLVTISAFYLALGIALLAGASWASGALSSVNDALSSTPVYIGQLVLGVGLVAISFRYDPKPRAKRKAARGGRPSRLEQWQSRAVGENATRRNVVSLALLAGLVESASMLPYLAAIGVLTASDLAFPVTVLALIGYVAVMAVPASALLGARRLAGDRLDKPLDRLRNILQRLTAGALGWVIGIIGFLLAQNALGVLVARGFDLGG